MGCPLNAGWGGVQVTRQQQHAAERTSNVLHGELAGRPAAQQEQAQAAEHDGGQDGRQREACSCTSQAQGVMHAWRQP